MPQNTIKAVIFGSEGRMGIELIKTASERPENIEILKIDKENTDKLPDYLKIADFVIDFSSPAGFDVLMKHLSETPVPLISGTTGLSDEQLKSVEALSLKTAVIHASNFSLGMNLVFYLTELCAFVLDESYEPEIIEIHHKNKKDAPSGTALTLANRILKSRKWGKEAIVTGDRYASNEPRKPASVGVQALRGGAVAGEHTVHFFGPGERIEITHKASERAIFARGAWQAALWLKNKPAGRYTMREVLGLLNPGI